MPCSRLKGFKIGRFFGAPGCVEKNNSRLIKGQERTWGVVVMLGSKKANANTPVCLFAVAGTGKTKGMVAITPETEDHGLQTLIRCVREEIPQRARCSLAYQVTIYTNIHRS